jgi:release factor glutamine methyltransferase
LIVAQETTIGSVLHDASARLAVASIDDQRLEAEVLFAHIAGTDRAHVLARLGDHVDARIATRFEALIARRLRHEPLAYIVGHREFFGIEIDCAPGALIPRPETEMLVELALAEVSRRSKAQRIADVGTGSGAIAIAIARNAPNARITAIDASPEALAIARRNIERSGVGDGVALQAGNFLYGSGTFDVIVANLPYVSEAEWQALPPEIRDHEPREALVGGVYGTEAIEQLLRDAPSHVASGGLLAAEMGATQSERLQTVAHACFRGAAVSVIKDLAGLDRVLVVGNGGG